MAALMAGMTLVGVFVFAYLILMVPLWLLGADWGKFGRIRRNKNIRKSEKDLPSYERIARAYEREVEKYLKNGWVDHAKLSFKDAEKTRKEGLDKLMVGDCL